MEELTKQQEARPENIKPSECGKKADPLRPGRDYVAWRIQWEERFGFKRKI